MGFDFTPEERATLKGWEDKDGTIGSSFRFEEWLTEASAHTSQHIGPAQVSPTIEQYAFAMRNGNIDEMRQRMAEVRRTAKELLTLGHGYGQLIAMMETEGLEVHDGPDGPVIIRCGDSTGLNDRRNGSIAMILEHPIPYRGFSMWEHASKPGTFNAKATVRTGWGYREDHEYMLWNFSMDEWDKVFAHGKTWVITGSLPVEIRQIDDSRYRPKTQPCLWWRDEDAA